jgi:nucleoside-diphosphate-sugar epimerase
VLVTGGAGFVGSHVVDGLVTAGYTVGVVDNLSTGDFANIATHINRGSVDFVKADIRDRDVMGKLVHDVDAVIHLAAIVSVPFSLENPRLTYDVNVDGTRELLASCVRSGVKKFVFVSSCSVYGAPRYLPVDEDHPTRPISPYASSKLDGERWCEAFNEDSGLDVVVLRLFNVYGPRQALSEYSSVITKFLECVKRSRSLVIYGDGSQTRDFVHVTDVANAILTLVKSDNVEGVFNIGYGRAVSIGDLAKTVLSLSGKDCGITYQPSRDGDIAHSVADILKARRAFAYSPQVPLEEGLQNLLLESRCAVR